MGCFLNGMAAEGSPKIIVCHIHNIVNRIILNRYIYSCFLQSAASLTKRMKPGIVRNLGKMYKILHKTTGSYYSLKSLLNLITHVNFLKV